MIPLIANVLLFVSALFATTFVVVYWVTAPWWRSEMGINIFALMAVIAAVLDLSVIRVWVPIPPDTPWFALLRLVVFALVPIVLGWRLLLLLRVQIRHRRRNGNGPDHMTGGRS